MDLQAVAPLEFSGPPVCDDLDYIKHKINSWKCGRIHLMNLNLKNALLHKTSSKNLCKAGKLFVIYRSG